MQTELISDYSLFLRLSEVCALSTCCRGQEGSSLQEWLGAAGKYRTSEPKHHGLLIASQVSGAARRVAWQGFMSTPQFWDLPHAGKFMSQALLSWTSSLVRIGPAGVVHVIAKKAFACNFFDMEVKVTEHHA